MKIGQWQECGFALGQPFASLGTLTFRTMPVTAAAISDRRVGAVFATRGVSAKRCRAAGLYSRHGLQLAEGHMARIGLAPGRPMAAEDVRNLERGTRHDRIR